METVDEIDQVDAQLVDELYDGLRRFAAVVAPWDLDPDDVLHTSLVSVLRSRRLATLGDPGAYLRRAIVNHVKSEVRRAGTRRRVMNRFRASSRAAVDALYPSDVADLMRLRPIERAVLYLHDIEGIPFAEAAAMVGITAGNARVTASRARHRLREVLVEEEER